MAGLDGVWRVERLGGLLPPMVGVRKVIAGDRGRTSVGMMLGVPFDVVGLTLRYRLPFRGFVDVLRPEGDRFFGRATYRGREFGTFRLSRIS